MPSKPSLILIPGLLLTADLWRDQIRDLADLADISVTTEQIRHESMAAIAAAILAGAPERFALAGLSMGGYVALELLRQAPERVVKLALLDTSGRADTPEQTATRRGLIELAEKGNFKGVTPRLLPMLVHASRLDDQPLVERILNQAAEVGRDGFFRQQRAIMGRIDSRPHLREIRCPTLVLCGREDQLTPPDHHMELATGIPDSRLVVVEDCGHLAPMERPERVTAELRRWLGA